MEPRKPSRKSAKNQKIGLRPVWAKSQRTDGTLSRANFTWHGDADIAAPRINYCDHQAKPLPMAR